MENNTQEIKNTSKEENKDKQRIALILISFLLLLIIGIAIYLVSSMRKDSQEVYENNYNILFGSLLYPFRESKFDYGGSIIIEENIAPEIIYKQLPVYKVDKNDPNVATLDLANAIAKSLNLAPDQVAEPLYSWGDNIIYMYFNNSSKSISIKFKAQDFISEKELIALTKAEKLAIDELEKLDLWPYTNNEYLTNASYLRTSGLELRPTSKASKADLIVLGFTSSILIEDNNLIPISSDQISVTITKGENIFSIEYNYLPIKYSPSGTYPLITFDQAKQKLRSNQGYLKTYSASDTTTIIVDDILIRYEIDPDYEYAHPVFAFHGYKQNSPDEEDVEILIPMLSDQYLIYPNEEKEEESEGNY